MLFIGEKVIKKPIRCVCFLFDQKLWYSGFCISYPEIKRCSVFSVKALCCTVKVNRKFAPNFDGNATRPCIYSRGQYSSWCNGKDVHFKYLAVILAWFF